MLPARRYNELPRLAPAPWYAGFLYSWRVGPAVWGKKAWRGLVWVFLVITNPRLAVVLGVLALLGAKFAPRASEPAQQQNPVEAANPAEEPKLQNECAPRLVRNEQITAQYIERFAPLAVSEMKKFGIPASITLAQGILESASGTSKLAVTANNHFGMKCFSKKCRKGHCVNATDDTHKDFFLKFDSPWGSWRKHSELLSNAHYKSLHNYGKDYKKWAYGLKNKRYATSRTYAPDLIGVIEKYKLYKFDQ